VATTTAGRLTSQVRQDAVWLSVLLECDPQNPAIAPLVHRIKRARSNGQWRSTLENASALAALARYKSRGPQEKPDFSGTILCPGRKAVRFDSSRSVSHTFDKITEDVVIRAKGSGRVYVAVTTEGLAREGLVKPYSRRLSVERRWSNRHGRPIDPSTLKVGDLVNVAITIRSSGEPVHNVAVVDALPGGMEVENPRLAVSARTRDVSGSYPDHVQFLDDRVVLFCTALPNSQTFTYALRAVAAGQFHLPPIQASCMYDPSAAALGKEGRVRVAR